MQIIDQQKWDHLRDVNAPDKNEGGRYGAAILTYAEAWADLMEARIAAGAKLEDVAQDAALEADTDGITGHMYGAAVATLAEVWVHGDALRRWHNLKTQRGVEGEIANETGATLNPAVLVFTVA